MGRGRGRRVVKEDREARLTLLEEAVSAGCRKKVACEDLDICEKTPCRWSEAPEDRRHGPKTTPANKLSKEERSNVISIANSKKYADKPPCQIVPLLADEGVYVASESTFYRILRAENLLAHRGKRKQPCRKKPKTLVATGPNQVYSWDITYLRSSLNGAFFYLYMFIDIWSRKIVGWEVHNNEDMIRSSQLIAKIYRDEELSPGQVTLHSDNGGPMKGSTMLATLQMLGIVPSFSRPRVSDDNPFSESLFGTMKTCPKYPSKPFETIKDAEAWVKDFVDWYNNDHLHSGIKFTTPASRHQGQDIAVLENRKSVYENAKKENPNRWSGEIRNWDHTKEVALNNLTKRAGVDRKIAS